MARNVLAERARAIGVQMLGGFVLGRIGGIEVYIDSSLFIVFFLATFGVATGVLPGWHPDWGDALCWAIGLAAALLLIASVLAHELAHAAVARSGGLAVRRVTLFVFGGMAEAETEPRTWRLELRVAAAGPAASFLLGAVCLLAGGAGAAHDIQQAGAAPGQLMQAMGPTATLLLWLGQVNVMLALFNLLPGFPLDGGRMLRAFLWRASGSLHIATWRAAQAGKGIALLLVAAGIHALSGSAIPLLGRGAPAGVWLILVGWFLYYAARNAAVPADAVPAVRT